MKTLFAFLVCALLVSAELFFANHRENRLSNSNRTDAKWEEEQTAWDVKQKIYESRDRLAKEELLKAITNEVIGIRSIILAHVVTVDDDTNKWTGFAQVEYINHFGGVDRTNLSFEFYTWTNRSSSMLFCQPSRVP